MKNKNKNNDQKITKEITEEIKEEGPKPITCPFCKSIDLKKYSTYFSCNICDKNFK